MCMWQLLFGSGHCLVSISKNSTHKAKECLMVKANPMDLVHGKHFFLLMSDKLLSKMKNQAEVFDRCVA